MPYNSVPQASMGCLVTQSGELNSMSTDCDHDATTLFENSEVFPSMTPVESLTCDCVFVTARSNIGASLELQSNSSLTAIRFSIRSIFAASELPFCTGNDLSEVASLALHISLVSLASLAFLSFVLIASVGSIDSFGFVSPVVLIASGAFLAWVD